MRKHSENYINKEKELICALEIGEQSGFIEDFNPKEFIKELHKKYV
ncbi:MAG: hypothetical protein AAF611_21450 [Bacteroidota bacterium]